MIAEGSALGSPSVDQTVDNKPIEALIRTENPPTAEEEDALRQVGWTTLSMIGRVLTGTVAGPRELEALLQLSFVRQVELSRPLYEELDVTN